MLESKVIILKTIKTMINKHFKIDSNYILNKDYGKILISTHTTSVCKQFQISLSGEEHKPNFYERIADA